MADASIMGDYPALILWKTEFALLQSVGIEFNFATIKSTYPGSWHDDVRALADKLGYDATAIITANPWLLTNNFPQDHDNYALLLIPNVSSSGSSGGGSSHGSTGIWGGNSDSGYTPPEGDDTTTTTSPSEGSWYWPMGTGKWYISQGYKSGHTALDITTGVSGGITGKAVHASKSGTVVQSYKSDSWGWNVLIKHTGTIDEDTKYCYYTRYAHLDSQPTVSVGDTVSQGATIGYAGNTGKSTGAHLHFQIYYTSSTRTDYANFNGSASFGTNPNGISTFPNAGKIYSGQWVNLSSPTG